MQFLNIAVVSSLIFSGVWKKSFEYFRVAILTGVFRNLVNAELMNSALVLLDLKNEFANFIAFIEENLSHRFKDPIPCNIKGDCEMLEIESETIVEFI